MIIHRIEVRNFRKLAEPIVIMDLWKGLTVVVGENEEGKSTLFQAIRSCFFDKHNMSGERAQSLQPYNSSVRPEVRIEFELNGQRYKLFKAFCQRPEAEMITPTGRLAGSAAEEELARLLRFTRPRRARREPSDHEHEGIFGMFWVEQGRSFTGVNPTVDGRSSIQRALQHEVGDVLGGKRGQRILAEITKVRNELLTGTGRPKGAYAKATQKLTQTLSDLAAVQAVLQEYKRKLEDLERCRARQRRYEAERTLERAQKRLRQAQEAADFVAALRRTAEQAEATLAQARAEYSLAANRLASRRTLAEGVETTKRAVQQLLATWEEKQQLLLGDRERLNRDEQELDKATARYEDAGRSRAEAVAAEELARTRGELKNLEQQVGNAIRAKEAADKSRQAATAIRMGKKDFTRLRQLHDSLNNAQAGLDAVATNLRVELQPGVKARLGRMAVVSGTEHRITETTVLDITGYAEVTVVPGGEIGNPRTELQTANAKLQHALAELGVANVTEAEAKLEERRDLLDQIEKHEQVMAAYAPEGIESLKTRIVELRGEIQRLGDFTSSKSLSPKEARTALDKTQADLEHAEKAWKAADRHAKDTRAEFNSAQQAEATSKAAHTSEVSHLEDLERRLSGERNQVSDAYLETAVLDGVQKMTAAEQTQIIARKEVEDANTASVELEERAAEEALRQLEEIISADHDRTIRLESELRATGAQGLGEHKQQLQAELQAARAAAVSIERKAKAVDLLHTVLTEAEKSAKETFLRPVTSRVQPYLRLLLPDTELRLSEELDIVGLRRGGVEEEFRSLSLGTREQLAVLTRLAFADLLRESGQPAAVVLDEALVYADDPRFKRMLHILRKAAEKTQIIVLTCHERDYEGAGAPIIRLADCRPPRLDASPI